MGGWGRPDSPAAKTTRSKPSAAKCFTLRPAAFLGPGFPLSFGVLYLAREDRVRATHCNVGRMVSCTKALWNSQVRGRSTNEAA
jgi:hypothetical protein